MNFYNKYIELCAKLGKTPSAVALENNLSKSTVNSWKVGRSNPTDVTLSKLAAYFNVSIEYLKNDSEEVEEIKKDPIPKTGNEVSDFDEFALNIIHKLKPEYREDAIAHLLELVAKSEGKR